MIADRIRQARLAAGLTLGALGEKVGVSHTAIQKYEKGLLTPSSSQLLKLARACDVRTEYFFRTHSVELLEPEFRKTAAFGKTAQDALKIKVVELVEKRVELLGAFPELPLLVFAPPVGLPEHIQALDEIEALADQARNAWQLGMNPIGDLTDTLEGLGLLVIVVDEEHPGFSGLTAKARTDDGREFRSWPSQNGGQAIGSGLRWLTNWGICCLRDGWLLALMRKRPATGSRGPSWHHAWPCINCLGSSATRWSGRSSMCSSMSSAYRCLDGCNEPSSVA